MHVIRPYDPAHRDAALDLVVAIWGPVFEGMRAALPRYVYGNFYPQGWEARQRADVASLLDRAGDSAWVAHAGDDTLVGLVVAEAHHEDRMGEIVLIGVHPDHRGTGIARALTDTALGWMRAQGLAFAMAETGEDPGHAPARAAYEALGFEPWRVVRYVREL